MLPSIFYLETLALLSTLFILNKFIYRWNAGRWIRITAFGIYVLERFFPKLECADLWLYPQDYFPDNIEFINVVVHRSLPYKVCASTFFNSRIWYKPMGSGHSWYLFKKRIKYFKRAAISDILYFFETNNGYIQVKSKQKTLFSKALDITVW